MPGNVKVSGIWRGIQKPFVKQGGLWVPVKEGLAKQAGVWEKWFTSAPATAPAQVTDLQITAYTYGSPCTFTLKWSPVPGVIDYKLDVFKYTSNTDPTLCWRGANTSGDGGGAERDYVPWESQTITPAVDGEYVYSAPAQGNTAIFIFRITPRNAIGSATWASNAPWVMTRSNPADVPLPTPLMTSGVTWGGTATSSTADFSFTPPLNTGVWGRTQMALVGPRQKSFSSGSGYEGYIQQFSLAPPTVSGTIISIEFPYGVSTAAVAFRGTGSIFNSGCMFITPGIGITRNPNFVVRNNKNGSIPFTLVAGKNVYEGGGFPDIGYTRAGFGSSPINIGSITPDSYLDFGVSFPFRGVNRAGNTSCSLWIQNSGILAGDSIRCYGYGDENELARYLRYATASYVADTGDGTSAWSWNSTSAADVNFCQPTWGMQNGLTYNFYFN